MLIFELSQNNRQATAQAPKISKSKYAIPAELERKIPPRLPACSELQVVRHFTRLSHKNFAIDSNFYPLGSCTMKYNPRGYIKQHPTRIFSTAIHLQLNKTARVFRAALSLARIYSRNYGDGWGVFDTHGRFSG